MPIMSPTGNTIAAKTHFALNEARRINRKLLFLCDFEKLAQNSPYAKYVSTTGEIMLKQKWTAIVGLVCAGILPGQAIANEGHITVGGNLGYYRFDHEDFPGSRSDFDDKRSSWKAYLGLQPNEVLGLELGYANFGKAKDSGDQFESDGVVAAVTAAIPFTPNFAVYGKLGQLFWERESLSPTFPRNQREGSDTFYGVGTRMALAPNLDLKLEYERFAIDRADVDMASLGLGINF